MNTVSISLQDLKLLAHVAPMPGESLAGFLIRCAEKSHLNSPKAIYRFVTGKAAYQLHERHIPLLSVMCQCSSEDIDQLFGFCYWRSGARHWKIGNSFLSKSYFVTYTTPKYCPACLQESAYWRAQWDLRFYLACSTHQLELITGCPQCKKTLRWNRATLLNCTCGFRFHEARTRPATPETAFIASLIDEELGSNAPVRHWTQIPVSVEAKLSGLSLDSLFKLLWLFGCILPAMQPASRTTSTTAPPALAIQRALEVLTEWPASFGKAVQRCLDRPISPSSASRLDKLFGPLQRYLYREMSTPELHYITHAYEQYARDLLAAFPASSRIPLIARQLTFDFNETNLNAR